MKTAKHIPKFSRLPPQRNPAISGKSGIPQNAGKSDAEATAFWDTHSITDYSHELKEVRNIEFPKPRKRLISVRMDDTQIQSLKQIATTKGIGYLTLMRMWITERLSKELRFLHSHRS